MWHHMNNCPCFTFTCETASYHGFKRTIFKPCCLLRIHPQQQTCNFYSGKGNHKIFAVSFTRMLSSWSSILFHGNYHTSLPPSHNVIPESSMELLLHWSGFWEMQIMGQTRSDCTQGLDPRMMLSFQNLMRWFKTCHKGWNLIERAFCHLRRQQEKKQFLIPMYCKRDQD